MVAFFGTIVRSLLLTAALALAAPVAEAARHAPHRTTEPSKSAPADTKSAPAGDEVPLDGLLIIAGIVVVVVLIAWLASRMGDNKPHVMG